MKSIANGAFAVVAAFSLVSFLVLLVQVGDLEKKLLTLEAEKAQGLEAARFDVRPVGGRSLAQFSTNPGGSCLILRDEVGNPQVILTAARTGGRLEILDEEGNTHYLPVPAELREAGKKRDAVAR